MQKNSKRKIGILMAVIIGVLVLVYIGISISYTKRFYPHTYMNGLDVSKFSVDDVKTVIKSGVDGYELNITARNDQSGCIKGTDIALEPKWDGTLEQFLKEQGGFTWIVALFSKNEYTCETLVQYDEQKLEQQLQAQSFMDPATQVAPTDAAISPYIDGVGYELVPATQGNKINTAVLTEAVKSAVEGLVDTLDIETTGSYIAPKILDDDEKLLADIDKRNSVCKAAITYTVGDETWVLDKDTYHDWYIFPENGDPNLDQTKVQEYVSNLASKYNTCYKAKQLKTSYGSTVTISNSHYGWKIDQEAETAMIIDELTNQKVESRDLNYSMTAASHGALDYGNSYVEINLTAQHLFVYVDGKLQVESDFVSGNTSNGNTTPGGAFGLTYKEQDAVLRGTNYATNVKYWMPFNGNIGMHDATWRSSFGAAIYKRSGSHGCINLPKSAAEKIFGIVDKNFPVLVYELAGTESAAGKAQTKAYGVIDKIRAIGTVDKNSKDKITKARAAYDALTDAEKKYVTNKATLDEAEKAFEKLEEADKEDEKTDKKTDEKEDTKADKKDNKDTANKSSNTKEKSKDTKKKTEEKTEE